MGDPKDVMELATILAEGFREGLVEAMQEFLKELVAEDGIVKRLETKLDGVVQSVDYVAEEVKECVGTLGDISGWLERMENRISGLESSAYKAGR